MISNTSITSSPSALAASSLSRSNLTSSSCSSSSPSTPTIEVNNQYEPTTEQYRPCSPSSSLSSSIRSPEAAHPMVNSSSESSSPSTLGHFQSQIDDDDHSHRSLYEIDRPTSLNSLAQRPTQLLCETPLFTGNGQHISQVDGQPGNDDDRFQNGNDNDTVMSNDDDNDENGVYKVAIVKSVSCDAIRPVARKEIRESKFFNMKRNSEGGGDIGDIKGKTITGSVGTLSGSKSISGIMKSASSPSDRKKRGRVEFSNIVNERRASNWDHQHVPQDNLPQSNQHHRDTNLSVLVTSGSTSTMNTPGQRQSSRHHRHYGLTISPTPGNVENNSTEEGRRGSDLMRLFTRRRSRSPTSLSAASCRRLQQPRLSLLGKPIVPRSAKQRDPRYRRTQIMIHNFLERPRGKKAVIYHLLQ